MFHRSSLATARRRRRREVVESRAREIQAGDAVTSKPRLAEYSITSPTALHPVSRDVQAALGLSWCPRHDGHDRLGWFKLVELKAGETIYISGAAGAVGNVAGQLAKLRGVGLSGLPVRGEGPVPARRMRV